MNNRLKITPEHYAALEAACAEVMASKPGVREQYAGMGLSPMRFRWDLLWAANDRLGGSFVTGVLYAYLNDAHIDSALKAIVG